VVRGSLLLRIGAIALGLAGYTGCAHSVSKPPIAAASQPAQVHSDSAPGTSASLLFPFEPGADRPESVAFVCDATDASAKQIDRLFRELQKRIDALQPDQQFSITIFQDDKAAVLHPGSVPAAEENKVRAGEFLDTVRTYGCIYPIPGLAWAIDAHPQGMYLLAGGNFPDHRRVLEKIHELDPDHATMIKTIACVGANDHDAQALTMLQQIADESGGTFEKVDADTPAKADQPTTRFGEAAAPRNRIAFLLNADESMAPKMDKLRAELDRAIKGFQPYTQFDIIFMQPGDPVCLSPELVRATPGNKRLAKEFVNDVRAGGDTDPFPAIQMAINLAPTSVISANGRRFF
jgi:von Willebrand factor type A domain